MPSSTPTKSIDVECWKCGGTGVYSWGGSVNGVPAKTGKCFNCAGKGVETPADSKRNNNYWNLNGARLQ